MRHEILIHDDGQTVIDRAEITSKINRLEMYINKVNRRLSQINAKKRNIQKTSEQISELMTGDRYEC